MLGSFGECAMRLRAVLRLAAIVASAAVPALAQVPLPLLNARVQAAAETGLGGSAATRGELTGRRERLLEVYRSDPAEARTYALPLATRQALLAADPTLAPLLEYEVTKTGELAAVVADDFTGGTSTTRYMLHTPSAELDLELPAAVLATAPADHHIVTVRGLGLGGVVAAESLTEAAPVDAAACAPPVSSRADTTAKAEAAPLTCSTFGNQRIAVLIVKFPNNTPAYPTGLDQAAYWNTVLFGQTPSVNTYWQEVSGGQTYATGDVYGPFQLGAQYDCTSTTAMQTAAIAAANGSVDFSQYNRVIIVYPVTSCTFGGLASVGCVGATNTITHQYSTVWLPVSANYKADFSYPQMWGGASHELGHNLGMNHANTLGFGAIALGPLDFSTTNPGTVAGPGSGTGTGSNLAPVNTEYGDNFDVMGYPWISGGPYNAVHRAKTLGWIPQADERDVTASGQYTLVPAESATGLRTLHVLRDAASTAWLWVEYHQATGYYESGNYAGHAGKGDDETTGAQIHYEAPIGANAYTYLLDMTPVASATAASNNFYDGTLTPGSSWSDPYSLLTLTAGTQSSAGLGVTVSYDTACASVALNASTIPAAGGPGTVTINAPASCTWTVSSNAAWISFPGPVSGSGSAMVPFTVSANSTDLQRNTYVTAQRQSLALLQPGAAITVAGVAPQGGSSVAGVAVPFTLSYSDALGLADVSQLNFDFTGFGNPDCQVAVVQNGTSPYLYMLANGAYSSGLKVGTAGTLTGSSCTISGAASSWTSNGTMATLTLGLTFTSAFTGEHNLLVSAYGSTASTGTLPMGIWTVTSAATALSGSSTMLSASPQPVGYGSALTLSAVVTSAGGTGTVNFMEGSTSLGSATLAGSKASFTLSTLSIGTHNLVAVYSGDTNVAGSSSPMVAVVVQPAIASVTLTPSAITVAYGSPLTLTAALTPSTATGTITFEQELFGTNSIVTLGTGTLAGGMTTYTTSTLPPGIYLLAAVYSGDTNDASGGSNLVSVTITGTPATTTTLVGSASSILPSGSVTLTAHVIPGSGLAQPTGTVSFLDGAGPLGTVALTGGMASYTASTLEIGVHTITAVYSSGGSLAGSTSNAFVVTVGKLSTTFAVSASAATVFAGSSITLTATPNAGSGVSATGSVTFTDGGATLASVVLTNGSASLAFTNLTAGVHSFGAAYSGSSDLVGSAGTPAAVAVEDFTLSTQAGTATLNAGTGESFSVTLTPGAAGFTSAIALSCTGAPAQAACGVQPGSVTPGSGPALATLTITTTARPAPAAGWLLLGLAPGLLALSPRRHRPGLLAAAGVFALLLFAGGCGQGNFFAGHASASGTPAGTYTLTVTGTATGSTTLVHAATVTLQVK